MATDAGQTATPAVGPTMQAAVVDEAGSPDVLHVASVPVPAVGADEVLIHQRLAAVNYGDVTRRKHGMFPVGQPPPYILGFEGVGEVVAVGKTVESVRLSDRVGYLVERGGYAELVAAPEAKVWHVPASVSDESAAGMTCVGLTAWGLVDASGVAAGEVALVHGASGGVGSILVQTLRSRGVRVVGLVTGSAKAEFVSNLGCDTVIDQGQDGSAADAIRSVAPAGIDVIYDCVGQAAMETNLAVVRPGGRWMYYGSTSGHPNFPGGLVLMNSLSIRGFVVFDYMRHANRWAEGTHYLGQALADGSLVPQTAEVLPIANAHEAHQRLEDRAVMGKLLLKLS